MLTLKGISYFPDHCEIFHKSSWMLNLSRSSTIEFPIFVSSANFEINLFSPTSMSFMYILWIGLVRKPNPVEHHLWLVRNPRQCHWWQPIVFYYLASFLSSCGPIHWFQVVWPWTLAYCEELYKTPFGSRGTLCLKTWCYHGHIKDHCKMSTDWINMTFMSRSILRVTN